MRVPPRSYLYVPGDRAPLVAKALDSDADAVILDLEDAVAACDKVRARAIVADALAAPHGGRLHVRISNPATPEGRLDVEALAATAPGAVRVAKVDDADSARAAVRLLREHGCDAEVHCLIESARGVLEVHAIATADPGVRGIALGEADLSADLGTDHDAALDVVRVHAVVAARAAGIDPPPQSAWTDLADDDGLRTSCAHGRTLGHFGRSAIHPRQIAAINAAYTPSDDEVARARAVTDTLAQGDGVGVTGDGRFVDPAVLADARRTLTLAGRYRASSAADSPAAREVHP